MMLEPNYFYGKSDQVIKYFQDVEDYLLRDIANFLLNKQIGGKADRELKMLLTMGMSNAEIVKRLSELTKKSRNSVRAVLQDSVMTSFSNDKAILERVMPDILNPMKNPSVVKVLDAEWKKVQGELENLTKTTMMQYQKDIIQMVSQADVLVSSGAKSYTEAICDILDDYSLKGLTVEYPSGTRRTVESAVRCAVVTGINQTCGQVTNRYIKDGGIEYVMVSAHLGARHDKKGGLYSHDGWQGKAYKIDGSDDGFPNLLLSTGYTIDAEGNGVVVNPCGLHGYNCRHSHMPWFKDMKNPWIDDKGNPIINEQNSIEVYEQQQKQRQMERAIRTTKRRLNMKENELQNVDDAVLVPKLQADYDRLAYRLQLQRKKYNEYCDMHDLQKQQDRIKVVGFDANSQRQATKRAYQYKVAQNDK